MNEGPADQPHVSVVIVTWNSREDVLRCLASLAAHVRLSHEVIVVDDGSDDGTPTAVREAYPQARLVAKPDNEGLVAGRNAALPLIQGKIVLMLDADTEVRP